MIIFLYALCNMEKCLFNKDKNMSETEIICDICGDVPDEDYLCGICEDIYWCRECFERSSLNTCGCGSPICDECWNNSNKCESCNEIYCIYCASREYGYCTNCKDK